MYIIIGVLCRYKENYKASEFTREKEVEQNEENLSAEEAPETEGAWFHEKNEDSERT